MSLCLNHQLQYSDEHDGFRPKRVAHYKPEGGGPEPIFSIYLINFNWTGEQSTYVTVYGATYASQPISSPSIYLQWVLLLECSQKADPLHSLHWALIRLCEQTCEPSQILHWSCCLLCSHFVFLGPLPFVDAAGGRGRALRAELIGQACLIHGLALGDTALQEGGRRSAAMLGLGHAC